MHRKREIFMTIYYFKKSIERKHAIFGTGKRGYYQSEQALIKAANRFFEETNEKITEKEKRMIISKTIPDYDFYAVQGWCDGFGNDTYTKCCFRTYQEAVQYVRNFKKEEFKIVGQWWGKEYINYWE